MSTKFKITNTHNEIAKILGSTKAFNEVSYNKNAKARDNLWESQEPQDILFAITGEKLDPDEYIDLVDAYERSYYDEFDQD